MKHWLILFSILFCGNLFAQTSSPRAFKHTLSVADSVTGSRVVVRESSDIEGVLNRAGGLEKVRGYRVRIFFDNSQNARSNAQAIMNQFAELFPDIPVYMIYENPYFKVAVGNCLTEDEAMIISGRIKGKFDRAFWAREDIPIGAFANKPKPIEQPIEAEVPNI